MSEIRVIHARGDGFARGMQVGAELQDLIQSSIAFYHRYLDRRGVSSEQLQDLLTPYLVAAETAYPDMMNVLKGMSVAALVPVLELFAINAFEEARQPKKLVILPGGHFDAYTTGFDEASGPARDWLVKHLVRGAQ